MMSARILRRTVSGALAAAVGAAVLAASPVSAADPAWDTVTAVKDASPWPVGVAIDSREMTGTARDVVLRHFDQITAENAMKPAGIWTNPAATDWRQWNWSEFDTHVDFARDHGLRMYAHTLIWHQQMPSWFYADAGGTPYWNMTTNTCSAQSGQDAALMRARMRTWIEGVAAHVLDRYGDFGTATNPIVAFDVVNEAIDNTDDHVLHANPFYCVLGTSYVADALRMADEALRNSDGNRTVKLFINDFNTEWWWKSDDQVAFVRSLLDADVPLDGVGHQVHVSLSDREALLEDQNLRTTFDQIAALGLEQAVTELDVGIGDGDGQLDLQGRFYGEVFDLLRVYDLFSVTVWGLHDGRTWRTGARPLLFTAELGVKPALLAVVQRAPVITSDLPTTVTGTVGEPVTLSIGVASDRAPMIQWQRRASAESAWSTRVSGVSTAFTFRPTAADDGDQYRAVVTNGHGSVTSGIAHLRVDEPEPPPPAATSVIVAGSLAKAYGTALRVPIQVRGATGGTIGARLGSWSTTATVGTGGAAVITLPARVARPGRATLVLAYAGTAGAAPSGRSVVVTTRRAVPMLRVVHGRRVHRKARLAVRVRASAAGLVPAGRVRVKIGATTRTVRLNERGRATVRVRVAIRPGRRKVVVTHLGTSLVARRSVVSTVRVVR